MIYSYILKEIFIMHLSSIDANQMPGYRTKQNKRRCLHGTHILHRKDQEVPLLCPVITFSLPGLNYLHSAT